jgi:DNA-binding IclR family transcriptional regulator
MAYLSTRTGAQVDASLDLADTAMQLPQVINPQTGTTYTLVMADKGKLVTLSNANAVTVTVETATATWAAGDSIDLLNIGAGAVTVAGDGVTVSKAADQTLTLAQGRGATLKFLSDSACWMVGGMGAT